MTTGRYPIEAPTAPSTPLPTAIAKETARLAAAYHTCLHSDSEILFEDVRQQRRRRWWLTTVMITLLVVAIGGLGAWVYSVGEGVGSARTEMGYMQRASKADRLEISRNSLSVRSIELSNATRYSKIEQMLTRLDARLENIEKSLPVRRR